jgi:hypothetical protein
MTGPSLVLLSLITDGVVASTGTKNQTPNCCIPQCPEPRAWFCLPSSLQRPAKRHGLVWRAGHRVQTVRVAWPAGKLEACQAFQKVATVTPNLFGQSRRGGTCSAPCTTKKPPTSHDAMPVEVTPGCQSLRGGESAGPQGRAIQLTEAAQSCTQYRICSIADRHVEPPRQVAVFHCHCYALPHSPTHSLAYLHTHTHTWHETPARMSPSPRLCTEVP